MHPERTLLVIPDAVAKAGLTTHVDRFPGATPARFGQDTAGSQGSGVLDEHVCREWLDGLDVVFTAETFYDWRFCSWARDAHVATVCMAMPEFCRPEWFAQPTQWWAPTTYMRARLPARTRVVPVPLATDRFHTRPSYDGPVRWLHVAGAQTIADRNGTLDLICALHAVKTPTHLTIRAQTPLELGTVPDHVKLTYMCANLDDYWQLYDAHDVMVLPRRYAGLCLPALEAMAAGLPVVMTDMAPQNTDWPVALTPSIPGAPFRTIAGRVDTCHAEPRALAELIDQWNTDRSLVGYHADRVAGWSTFNSWEALKPTIVNELERAVALA